MHTHIHTFNGVATHFIILYDVQVLMFGNASVAEEVCHLNRWDKCSLPINALETALELRQLDTLAFFLRSRDNGKCTMYSKYVYTMMVSQRLKLVCVCTLNQNVPIQASVHTSIL